MSLELTENARRVLAARYLRRNARGEVYETPEELFARVARAVSQAELIHGTAEKSRYWEEQFHTLLSSLVFLPNSPALMNAGTALGQLSACFVLPVEDSMESIFGTLHDMALVQRMGGGTGFSFSRLRPAGDLVRTTGGRASGPVSFMRIYDSATENIKQGGRRRGANMAVLRVDHPDVEEFIHAKRDGSLRNFNLSVGVTDEYMNAIESDGVLELRHPADGRVVATRPARAIFEAICDSAWACGDPGLIFLDTIEKANPTPSLGKLESTNPCGELPLLSNEACTLGSINVSRIVSTQGDITSLDWNHLRTIVHTAVRFLDDVLTVNQYPTAAIASITTGNRKIGLGVMGFAELCIQMGISYASSEALRMAEDLMKFITAEARTASMGLANERGPFANWHLSIHAAEAVKLRNATLTSVAPTGTIAIIAGTSSSIEPLFALAYRRHHALGGEPLVEVNPLFLRHLEKKGLPASEFLHAVTGSGTSVTSLLDSATASLFPTALEIEPRHHVLIQAAFQKHVDNAVSKTVNMPESATPEDIAAVYLLAHNVGCKGITVFRYGSRQEQVLELGLGEASYEREHFAKCDPGACRL